MAVCGVYAIRPYTGTRKNGDFSIHSTTGVAVCGAYAIRPYPDGRNSIHFFAHSTSGMFACGAYAVAPYTGDLKNGDFSIHSTTGVAVCGVYAVAPLHGYPKKWRFFYPFDHRRGRPWGVCCCALHGYPKKLCFFYPFDHCRGRLWGVCNTPHRRTDENRAGFWFVFRGGAEKGAGRGLCEKWGRRASIIIRRLLPLRARRRMGPIIASAHAFIIPNYVA